MPGDVKIPFDPGPAAWRCIAGEVESYPPLQGVAKTDFAVVGAGFAGLAAARRLKQLEPDSGVVLVDARDICEGSSGRNSGFMIDLPHNLGSADYVGSRDADLKQIQMNREAIQFAQSMAEETDLPSEAFGIFGKVNAAATEKGLRHNEQYAEHLVQLGERFEMLDEQHMREISGSSYYLGGLATFGNALIKPGLYFDRFAKCVHQAGVEIYTNTPVLQLDKRGKGWSLKTPEGAIEAANVIMTVNGHIESFGFFSKRLMHIYLYGSMTRALTAEEVRTLGGEASWGFTPADSLGSTVRRISGIGGDRILVRNGITWAPSRSVPTSRLDQMAKHHKRSFKRRFPNLPNVQMEYCWGGLLCLSRNSVPAFGELEYGLYSACCQNGLGASHGTLHGKLIAELACGYKSESLDIVLGKPPPQKLPPEPFVSIGAELVTRWGEFKAGKEK